METSHLLARRAVLALLPISFVQDDAEEALALLNRARKLSISKTALAAARSESGLDLLQTAVAFDAFRCVEILIKSQIFPVFEANPKAADILDTLLRLGVDRKADNALRVIAREGNAQQDGARREAWGRRLEALVVELAAASSRHARLEALAEEIPRALAVTAFNALPADRRAALPALAARVGQSAARKKLDGNGDAGR